MITGLRKLVNRRWTGTATCNHRGGIKLMQIGIAETFSMVNTIEGTDRTWLSSSTAFCFTREVLWK